MWACSCRVEDLIWHMAEEQGLLVVVNLKGGAEFICLVAIETYLLMHNCQTPP